MGISTTTAQFLIEARAGGVSLGRIATLARQHMTVSPPRLARMLKQAGIYPQQLSHEEFYRLIYSSPFYADGFLRLLAAKDVISIDFSDYEHASVIHDLNQPVPQSLHQQFDTVCDFGTLEHVFNFPVAIRNCMEMLKV